jgi:hypothetical protein
MRPTLSPPFCADPTDETLVVDAGQLAALLEEATPRTVQLGGPVPSAAYVARIVAAARVERRARLGARCP